MSDNEIEEEVPDYKTKRLEVLARAREIARQNRLEKTSKTKQENAKLVEERKQARLTAHKQVKEKQQKKEEEETEPEPELESIQEEPEPDPPPKPKPPKKTKKPKQKIIVEESSESSESETEEIIIVKKKKEKKPPPQRIVYRNNIQPQPKQSTRQFRDFFTL